MYFSASVHLGISLPRFLTSLGTHRCIWLQVTFSWTIHSLRSRAISKPPGQTFPLTRCHTHTDRHDKRSVNTVKYCFPAGNNTSTVELDRAFKKKTKKVCLFNWTYYKYITFLPSISVMPRFRKLRTWTLICSQSHGRVYKMMLISHLCEKRLKTLVP